MDSSAGRSWAVVDRPIGRAIRFADFALREAPACALEPGEIRMRLRYLGFAPSIKLQMENAAPYAAPIALGDVMRGAGVGEVIESADPALRPGDMVSGNVAWSEVQVARADGAGLRRLLKLEPDIPPPAALALLQSGGLTAYFGLLEIGRPRAGDTVVVSGAAGAVGSTVGQIARLAGCRTVGIAGGPAKCAWLLDQGFNGVVDYLAGDLTNDLARLCPDGIDVFFDNVGGEVLEAGIANIARHGRIVLCGAVSQYGAIGQAGAIRNHMELVFKSASLQGFLIPDFADRFDEARRRLSAWFREGQLKPQVDILEGFENAPAALIRMFEGRNFGRQMLRVGDPD